MAIVFIDGFDHYGSGDATSKWNSANGNLGMVTGRFGGQALYIQRYTNASYLARSLGETITDVVVGFAFFSAGAPGGTEPIFEFTTSGADSIEIQYTSGGVIQFSQGTTTMSPAAITPNQWNYIEIVLHATSTSSGTPSQIYVNGTLYQAISSFTGGTSLGGGVDGIRLRVGTNANDGAGNFTFDDLYVLALDGTYTGPLGECRIEALYPNAAGSNTNWTNVGGSSNYQSVDNTTPDGDSSYVVSGTVGTVDTYGMSDLSSTPTTIFCVQANLWARKDNTSIRSISAAFKIGSTLYYSGTTNPFSGYADDPVIVAKSPATMSAWTASEINGFESGPNLAV
jgi:hypothetical protein